MAKYCSSRNNKDALIQDIMNIPFEDVENNNIVRVKEILQKFLITEEYYKHKTKMLLRG